MALGKKCRSHPFSRACRRLFENRKIRKIFGLSLATLVIFSGLVGSPVSALTQKTSGEITSVPAAKVELLTKESVRNPLDSFNLSQGYNFLHRGIDLRETAGMPVFPVMEGKVEKVSYGRFSYGNHLVINHGSGYRSLYAHLSKVIVKEGDEVDTQTVIGLVGSTGWSTGNHLHFEISQDGRTFNPMTILSVKYAKK